MHFLLVSIVLLMGAAVGWSIGANDAANSLGVAVGSKILTLKRAILLIAVFGFLGAYLQGSHVAKTIGKGIVPINELEGSRPLYVALVASFAACCWVVLATYWRMPISTSHSIVGAVVGAGIAIGAPVKYRVLFDIFKCWFFTPLGAAVLGFILYQIFKISLYRIIPRRYFRAVMATLIVTSGSYVAYTWGANDVANATGVVVGAGILSPTFSVALGGVAIIIGIVTWGYKVIGTVGSEITHLLPIMAFSAQLASAVNVHIYTLFGMPVSTSHSIVGAIFGVGLVRGVRVLNIRIIREIIICWLATPFVSGIISFMILKSLTVLIKI
ncbi:anion permease [bacterium]|nr:MAG: anion permease [bacterium]